MSNFAGGTESGVLAILFLQKLGERLEGNGNIPSGTTAAIWGDVFTELKKDGRQLASNCRRAMIDLKLAKE